MKAVSTIRAELRRVRRLLDSPALDAFHIAELRGAQQALAWALGQYAMGPAQAATLETLGARPKEGR